MMHQVQVLKNGTLESSWNLLYPLFESFHTENTSWETLHIQPPPIIPWMVIQFHKFLVGPKEQLH